MRVTPVHPVFPAGRFIHETVPFCQHKLKDVPESAVPFTDKKEWVICEKCWRWFKERRTARRR